MADEFTIDTRTSDIIKVRHVTSGHRFTSHIWVQPLRRALRAGWVQANMNSSMPSDMFKAGARAFAEREARAAGLID